MHPLEDDYLKIQSGFHWNLTQAIWAYSVSKGLGLRATKDESLDDRLNQNPYTWKTILWALQTTWMMGASKLSDHNSKSSIKRFISFCRENLDLFSRDALLARKKMISTSFGERLFAERYLSECHFPTADDFNLFDSEMNEFADLEEVIRILRNKVFAHDDLLDDATVHAHFEGIVNTRVESFLAKAHLVHSQIHRGMFLNGHKPRFDTVRSFDDLADPCDIFNEVDKMSLI